MQNFVDNPHENCKNSGEHTMKEKWILENKKADFRGLAERLGVSPLMVKLAVNRGYRTEKELNDYFYGTREEMHDGAQMKDASKAALLLEHCIRRGGRIGIASDFDVDGIFSALILYKAITRLGGQARIYTPDRVAEGYGLNMRIVSQAVEEDTELLITCDNGIAAAEPISYARELGITTIVTDHHEVPFSLDPMGRRCYHLPDADAIVNPKQEDCTYPYKGLCGAGVAYKVAQLLYERAGLADYEMDELLTYAAIATVADVMDLTGENRIIVKYGLYLLKRTTNVGLRALMSVTGVDPENLNTYHIGFVLGPCFNATGRLRTVEMAFDLLLARDMEKALPLALELKQLNDSRKDMTLEGVERACRIIEEDDLDQMPVMVVYLPGTHESLAGIIAGRLRETYHHPIYVVVDGETGLKASGRSIEAYSMYEHLQKCDDLLTRYGGHPMAAGLSLPEVNLPAFIRRLNEDTGLTEEDFRPIVRIDAAVPIQLLSEQGIQELELLEPFGKGNTKPLFAEQHFVILRARILGKNRNAMKLTVRNDAGCQMEAMYFGDIDRFDRYVTEEFGADQLEAMYAGRSNQIDLGFVYYPSVNEFRGARTLQIVVQHYCRIRR